MWPEHPSAFICSFECCLVLTFWQRMLPGVLQSVSSVMAENTQWYCCGNRRMAITFSTVNSFPACHCRQFKDVQLAADYQSTNAFLPAFDDTATDSLFPSEQAWLPTNMAKRFDCSFCHKRFNTSHGKTNHERLHNGKGIECEECHKLFICKAELLRHRGGVHGRNTFSCEKCHRTFSWEHNLKSHMRLCHKVSDCPS